MFLARLQDIQKIGFRFQMKPGPSAIDKFQHSVATFAVMINSTLFGFNWSCDLQYITE